MKFKCLGSCDLNVWKLNICKLVDLFPPLENRTCRKLSCDYFCFSNSLHSLQVSLYLWGFRSSALSNGLRGFQISIHFFLKTIPVFFNSTFWLANKPYQPNVGWVQKSFPQRSVTHHFCDIIYDVITLLIALQLWLNSDINASPTPSLCSPLTNTNMFRVKNIQGGY